MRIRGRYIWMVLVGLVLLCAGVRAQDRPAYLCEIGLQGGVGYHVGESSPHIFMHPREAYGLHFRYKFTKRWALQAKLSGQRIAGDRYTIRGVKMDSQWQNRIYSGDLMAEFNFFRFGAVNKYDKRLLPYTPYIFAGVGASIYHDMRADGSLALTTAGYIPVGIGFKWRFAEHAGLNIAWQHNIYFSDDLEAQNTLNNLYHMNGWNWMNCDVTGMLTIGIVFEFLPAPNECRLCKW